MKEELKLLEADEKAAKNKKSTWKLEETALGNNATVVKHRERSGEPSRVPMCRFFQKTGTCRFGEKCRFKHSSSSTASSSSQTSSPTDSPK
eukprot:1238820-Prorocentrum_lima.AAC.1